KGEIPRNRGEDNRIPFAWTYRDYVIRAFNDDKPYDQFIREQIAADRIVGDKDDDKGALAAMGFLTLGQRFNNSQNDIINDRIDVVTKGFMGLTVTCARCHDHKFDPIPTADYYSMHGIFSSSREPEDAVIIANMSKLTNSPLYSDYKAKAKVLDTQIEAQEEAIKQMRRNKATNKDLQAARRQLGTYEGLRVQLDMTHPSAPDRAMVMEDKPRPADSPIFIRGEANSKGRIVPRAFIEVLSGPDSKPFRDGSGRLELANSIASKDNPLTARVMINRIWQHHFGEGFVSTPDDFGNQSAPPSHPDLLDYLATRFMQEGWSMKKIHRLILMSNTYQESSETNDQYAQIDPYNRLLWRANVRRLEFEALRDTMLFLSRKLDTRLYGRPVDLTTEPYSLRRSVYGYIDRANLAEIFTQFDFASPEMTTGKRYDTIVPQQSLYMMNSSLVVEAARHLLDRSEFRKQTDEKSRVNALFELVYNRPATDKEIELSLKFVAAAPKLTTVENTAVKV
ncbi:MAG TPA: DUF1549 and DUF1553 domain-containing protein, partial [Roseimicrobium sp.]|nr:DUF1549 and DUF1553 domain-containing protein [Roseimicrobium sp.]